jgi:hypothetical protein
MTKSEIRAALESIGPLRQPATKQRSTKSMRTAPSASTLSRASELSEDKTCRLCGATIPASPPVFVSAGSWDLEISASRSTSSLTRSAGSTP